MNEELSRDVALFGEALVLPAAERSTFLERACGGEVELRQRVEGLLLTHDQAGGFLERPPVEMAIGSRLGAFPGKKPGERIGRYKLLQQIGEGGCGVVFVAEQEEPVRRRVALKLIKPGMDTKSVIARFEAERQALALMDHPNIAHVLDAGATESGRPYFVMELVEGVKISDYCDQHSLPLGGRLELFVRVCDAIQHAHQKGIIHRDIKPSNVLVATGPDGKATPKIIDFGIAKATDGQQLTDKTIFTAHEMLIGTPAYMSPEQAALASAEVDTRTDIYSLGVLLYELLTCTTPFHTRELLKAGFDEVRRVIRDEEPVRPSMRLTMMTAADLENVSKHHGEEPPKLIREMRGELDWIVMKALEKDRARRYQTANAFAYDLHRYIKYETVSARPPSRVYQFRKFVSRHKLGFAAFGIVMVTLVAGLSSTLWSLAKEKKARSDAEDQRKKAQAGEEKALTEAARSKEVTEFLKKMLVGIDPSVALGRDTTVLREILDKTVEHMRRELTNQPAIEADLKVIIGGVYEALHLWDKAELPLRSALTFYRESPPGAEKKTANVLSALSFVHLKQSRLEEAEQESREAFAIDPSLQVEETMRRVSAETGLAWVILGRNRPAEAEPIFRKALTLGERLVGDESEKVLDDRAGLATALNLLNRLPEAESLLRKSLAVAQKRYRPDHPYVANDMYRLAFVLAREKKLDEAETLLRQCVAIRRKMLGPDDPLFDQALLGLASLLRVEDKLEEAADVYRELLELRRKQFGDEHSGVTDVVTDLAKVLTGSHNDVQFEQLGRDFPKIWLTRSEELARRGQWSESLAAAARFVQLQPAEYRGYYHAAPLLVQIGDRAAYEELCAKITTLFAGTTNLATAERMAKACLILPRPGADLKVASELASIAVAGGQKDGAAKCTAALAEYRQGHWDGAADWAMKATENPSASSRAEAYSILAMAQYHSQQTEAARVSLKKCTEIVQIQLPKLENGDLGGDWRGWIYAHALQSEAKRMIDGEPSSAARPANLPP